MPSSLSSHLAAPESPIPCYVILGHGDDHTIHPLEPENLVVWHVHTVPFSRQAPMGCAVVQTQAVLPRGADDAWQRS